MSSKKSEMLEVRISYEDKQSLQAKAQKQGVSVSKVVRHLISDYLVSDIHIPSDSRRPLQKLKETFMKTHFKTKSMITAIGLCCLGAFAFAPLTAAEELGLRLQGSSVQSLEEGTRTRRFDTDILIDEGKTLILGFNGSVFSEQDFQKAEDGDLMLILSADQTKNSILMNFKIHQKVKNTNGAETKLIASPKITANFDEESKIIMTMENNEILTLIVTPHDTQTSG